ncbi:hypothetical protein BDZ89DRAFT_79608 [Hymenopellis radicata]|nr:hypothetical protein BDZ89DRAFT_79608 [Hymenopellis radicata]
MERFPALKSLTLGKRCKYPDRPDLKRLEAETVAAIPYPTIKRLSVLVKRETDDWRRLFSSIVFRKLEQLSVPDNSTWVELNAIASVAPHSITSLTLPYTPTASQDWDTETGPSHPIDILLRKIAHATVTFPTQEVSITRGRTPFPTWWVHKLGQSMDHLQTLNIIVDFVSQMDESYGEFYDPAFWRTFDVAVLRNVLLDSVEIIVKCTINGDDKNKADVTRFCEMVKRHCSELGKGGEEKFKIVRDIA